MELIRLSEKDIIESTGHSSKGNQPKWFLNDIWYKADHMGYEGLAEIVVSRLLKKTNIENFVLYYPVKIEFSDYNRSGCFSYNFLKKDEELITIERLHRLYEGVGLSRKLQELNSAKEKIKYTVDFTQNVTGLKDFSSYLTAMLEIDAFFLNEDRHTNNIAFIRNSETKKFRLCPYFDQGLSLLSDLEGFWLDGDTDKHIMRVEAKPFGSFKTQVSAVRELYGKQLEIKFKPKDVETELCDMKEYYNDNILNRVEYIITKQLKENSSSF
jgi:hypothetical protein